MNKAKPVVKIVLDKERSLKFDFNALVAIEEATGGMISSLAKKGRPLRYLRVLLWAGLLHEDETLTEKQVGSWITPENMKMIDEKISQASQLANDDEVEGKDPLPNGPNG